MQNLDFLYKWQQSRYQYFFNKELPEKDELEIIKENNAYILPPKVGGRLFGTGAVLDSEKKVIRESYIYGFNNIYMGGVYDISSENLEYWDDEYIYLGFICNHWGHFIVDFSTRLYYAIKNPDKKMIFMVTYGDYKFELMPVIERFLTLAGLNINNINIVSKVIQVKSLIIPQTCYITGNYTSRAYKEIFDSVSASINPTVEGTFKNVYFSRAKFDIAQNKELGFDLIDQIFAANDFKIVYPEQETLDNQIYYLNNTQNYWAITGTLIHNANFLNNQNTNIHVINKTYHINPIIFDSAKIFNFLPTFYDFYMAIYPVSIGYGPFLFVINDLFRRFLNELHLHADEIINDYINKLKTHIEDYFKIYKFYVKWKNYRHTYVNNEKDIYYFPPEFTYLWANDYIKYIC